MRHRRVPATTAVARSRNGHHRRASLALAAATAGLANPAVENWTACAASVAIFFAETEMLLVERSEAEHPVVVTRVLVTTALAASQAAQRNR